VLTKEPEMLQPDAFYEHTMQQNVTAARALSRTQLQELTVLPQTSSCFKGVALRWGGGREGRGGEEKGKRGERDKGSGRGGRGRLTLMCSWNRAAD